MHEICLRVKLAAVLRLLMHFRRILVPYDDSIHSKRALKKAFALAEMSEGEITIVHVISYHKTIAKIIEPYKESLIEHVQKFMRDIGREASRRDIALKKEILYGNPAEKILDLLKKKRFDIVIMGRRGTNKFTGPSLGSVSNSLVQNSKVPVMVVT